MVRQTGSARQDMACRRGRGRVGKSHGIGLRSRDPGRRSGESGVEVKWIVAAEEIGWVRRTGAVPVVGQVEVERPAGARFVPEDGRGSDPVCPLGCDRRLALSYRVEDATAGLA